MNLSGLYRFYSSKLEKEITEGDMPNHIAIVLDGNRRWAKRNLVIEKQGHFKGADANPFPSEEETPPVIKTKCITEARDI